MRDAENANETYGKAPAWKTYQSEIQKETHVQVLRHQEAYTSSFLVFVVNPYSFPEGFPYVSRAVTVVQGFHRSLPGSCIGFPMRCISLSWACLRFPIHGLLQFAIVASWVVYWLSYALSGVSYMLPMFILVSPYYLNLYGEFDANNKVQRAVWKPSQRVRSKASGRW